LIGETIDFGVANKSFIFKFLSQLRKAIEDANAGILPMHSESHVAVSISSLARSETDTESNKNVSGLNSIVSVNEKADKI